MSKNISHQMYQFFYCIVRLFSVQKRTKEVITKTYLYNVDHLKPHFYIVKLGFTGVYLNFLISAQNIYCRYSLEPPRRGGSNEYPQSMFFSRNTKKYQNFYPKIFNFFGGKIFSIQLTPVISNSLISNNRLSRRENLFPAQTWKSNNM